MTPTTLLSRPARGLDAGRLLREARRRAGLTQADLAARIGTRQSVVSRWERGVDEPRLSTLVDALRACGYETDLSFRHREDVDRSQLALHLAMTPAQRARHHRAAARAVARARRARPAA